MQLEMTLPAGQGPELFFGLVGAVGTDLPLVSRILGEELSKANYKVKEIRLSSLLDACFQFQHLKGLASGPEDERIDAYMDAGDKFREIVETGDAVALLAVSKITEIRNSDPDEDARGVNRVAYVFNSLKHPEELRTLQKIYGEKFFTVAAYSPRQDRLENLAERIKKSRKESDKSKFRHNAQRLIERDMQETENSFGQNVRNTFPLADVFVRVSTRSQTQREINRFVRLLFGDPFVTPTSAEYGMFHAKAVALRSSDLSRQVGAVIMTEDGEFISAGCNEVPKVGGGAVWEGGASDRQGDYRDFILGRDSGEALRREMMAELLSRLTKEGWLDAKYANKNTDDLVTLATKGDKPILKGTRFASILEYGRMVHAEMFAICDAARRGHSVKDQYMFCTTYPCHMCARHILAAGIKKVVYIEPYPKSLAKELYERMIKVEGDSADDDALEFEPFVGVAPTRYLMLFEMGARKDDKGDALKFELASSKPRIQHVYPTHIELETGYVAFLKDNEVRFGIVEGKMEGSVEKGRTA